MTELVKREDSLAQKMEYAKALAPSDLLPRQYRDKPANVLLATEYGETLGLSPMAAIQGIHVIEGKPSASADMIAALIRRAGHTVRVTGDAKSATCQIIRKDDPEFTYEATWTIEDAKDAGLLGKDNWKKHPRQMLKRRAVAECGHDACSDVLAGLVETDEAQEAARPKITATRLIPDAVPQGGDTNPPVDVETGEILEGEVVEDVRTEAQSRKLFALLRGLGIADKDSALQMVGDILGRDVDSTKTLTKDEASTVIDALEQMSHETGEIIDGEVVDEASA